MGALPQLLQMALAANRGREPHLIGGTEALEQHDAEIMEAIESVRAFPCCHLSHGMKPPRQLGINTRRNEDRLIAHCERVRCIAQSAAGQDIVLVLLSCAAMEKEAPLAHEPERNTGVLDILNLVFSDSYDIQRDIKVAGFQPFFFRERIKNKAR